MRVKPSSTMSLSIPVCHTFLITQATLRMIYVATTELMLVAALFWMSTITL